MVSLLLPLQDALLANVLVGLEDFDVLAARVNVLVHWFVLANIRWVRFVFNCFVMLLSGRRFESTLDVAPEICVLKEIDRLQRGQVLKLVLLLGRYDLGLACAARAVRSLS